MINVDNLRVQAEEYRILYKTGQCAREEAKNKIQPFLNVINKKSIELAKKYNQKPKKISFAIYVRWNINKW